MIRWNHPPIRRLTRWYHRPCYLTRTMNRTNRIKALRRWINILKAKLRRLEAELAQLEQAD